jgi:hypothetical protein
MHPEDRFQLVQKRAYEIYEHRDPSHGTPEEDWRKAEREVEEEEQVSAATSRPTQRSPWDELRTRGIENPT